MEFIPTDVSGAFILKPRRFEDDRGFFCVPWSGREFAARGLSATIAQVNFAYNRLRGTMRGLHYQIAPAAEVKTVRCIRGAVFDAIVDLRPQSPTYLKWTGVELSAENQLGFYIPQMCAHGYITLSDDAEVMYQVSADYAPELARGYRPDDPAFAIHWPIPTQHINQRDANWPLFDSTKQS